MFPDEGVEVTVSPYYGIQACSRVQTGYRQMCLTVSIALRTCNIEQLMRRGNHQRRRERVKTGQRKPKEEKENRMVNQTSTNKRSALISFN
jgi:hypothetical protein